MTDTVPDRAVDFETGTVLPALPISESRTDSTDTADAIPGIGDVPERIDNISETALRVFCEHYRDDSISKDVIFDYVYGVHARTQIL